VSRLSPILTVELPSGGDVSVMRRRFGLDDPSLPRVAIVAGIRGDAPEGVRVAHVVASLLEAREPRLKGVVDLYPCVNPLAALDGTRHWPFFDVDLNRLFPGRPDGHPPDRVADALVRDVRGALQVIELRGAREAFAEVVQAQIRLGDTRAAELATHANVRLVWTRAPGAAAATTFAHQFADSLVLEGGTGNRLTPGVGVELVDGIMNLLVVLGVLDEGDLPFHWASMVRPVLVNDEQVHRVRSLSGGLFLPDCAPWDEVDVGEKIGSVVDPVSGAELETVVSPHAGRVCAVRERPVVYPGSMVARVVAL
jgi:uncharacterized protein